MPRGLHAVERNRLLTAAALGYSLDLDLDYGLSAIDPEPREAPYLVLLTMTSRDDKLWAEENWIELGSALGVPAVLPWGSETERSRAGRIAAALPADHMRLGLVIRISAR